MQDKPAPKSLCIFSFVPYLKNFCLIAVAWRRRCKNKAASRNVKKSFQLFCITLFFRNAKGIASNAPLNAMIHFAATTK